MEGGRRAKGLQAGQGGRRSPVHRLAQDGRFQIGPGPEAHELREGVDAGVRARRHFQPRCDAQGRKRVEECLLDRGEPRLALEAPEGAAVVGDAQRIPSLLHGVLRSHALVVGANAPDQG